MGCRGRSIRVRKVVFIAVGRALSFTFIVGAI